LLLLLLPGEMVLVASVLGTSAAQQQLVPALMRVYSQADFVVGLDVDRDDYDKFTVRVHGVLLYGCVKLVMKYWRVMWRACLMCAYGQADFEVGLDPGSVKRG
jgi:hypothetical protein